MTVAERDDAIRRQLRIYAQTMPRTNSVPLVCVGVNPEGMATVCLNEEADLKKVKEYLKQLLALLEKKT